MTDILIYLLKVSLAISLVILPYYLWLRQDASLNIKRFYMTGGILLSWLFPLMVIRKPIAISTITNAYLIDPGVVTAPITSTLQETPSGFTFSLFSFILIIYLLGLLLLTMRHFFMFRKLNKMERCEDSKDNHLIFTNSNQIFTLFSKIFIPADLKSSKDINSILIHEKAHLQQLHMIDLIIAETTLLFTWFNPFSWLISRMIKENHEHLADRTVLLKGVNPAHYKAQLLNHAMGVELFRLGNQFNHSLTKKRFQMMKKIKSPKKGIIKYLTLVPAIVVSLGLFTAASAQQRTFNGKVVFEDGSPAHGTSIVVVGGTIGTVADRDGTFSLELDGNPELAISYVGYKTERVYVRELNKQDIVLHPKAFEIDLKEVKSSDPKANKIRLNTPSSDGETMNPVFVVDGKIVEEIESISPDDIAQITVIKDSNSAEAKKYKAKNGVLMITMKEKRIKAEGSTEEEIFFIVEDMPSFPGGKERMKGYIYENLVYPEKAKKKGLTGDVYVQFIVNTKGKLQDIEIKKSNNEIFNNAALKVFRDMPTWNPGKQRGKAVKVNVIVPVRFKTDQE